MSLSLIRKTQGRFGDIHGHSQCHGQAENDAYHQTQKRSTPLLIRLIHGYVFKIN